MDVVLTFCASLVDISKYCDIRYRFGLTMNTIFPVSFECQGKPHYSAARIFKVAMLHSAVILTPSWVGPIPLYQRAHI